MTDTAIAPEIAPPELDHEPPTVAHYIKTPRGMSAEAVVLDALVNQTPVTSLCGRMWVPTRDPQKFPVCPECKQIRADIITARGGTP